MASCLVFPWKPFGRQRARGCAAYPLARGLANTVGRGKIGASLLQESGVLTCCGCYFEGFSKSSSATKRRVQVSVAGIVSEEHVEEGFENVCVKHQIATAHQRASGMRRGRWLAGIGLRGTLC